METSITLVELGMVILFVLLAAAAGFGVQLIRNYNRLVIEARQALAKNQAYIDNMAPDLGILIKNSAGVSRDLALGVQEVSETAVTLGHTIGNLSMMAVGLKELLVLLSDVLRPPPGPK